MNRSVGVALCVCVCEYVRGLNSWRWWRRREEVYYGLTVRVLRCAVLCYVQEMREKDEQLLRFEGELEELVTVLHQQQLQ